MSDLAERVQRAVLDAYAACPQDDDRSIGAAALRVIADYAEQRVPGKDSPERYSADVDHAAIGVETFIEHLRKEASRG